MRSLRVRRDARSLIADFDHRFPYLQDGDLVGALETMLTLEKKTRMVRFTYAIWSLMPCNSLMKAALATLHIPLQAGDAFATSKVAVAMVKLCHEVGDLKQLNAYILILAKRRGQLKQVR